MTIPSAEGFLPAASCLPCTAEEEREAVAALTREAEENVKDGDLRYLVSQSWWSNWQRYVGLVSFGENDTDMLPEATSRPGEIDNSKLVLEETSSGSEDPELQRTLREGQDYTLVPHEVWRKLCECKEWVRSTRPYPISISLRTIRDILDANKPMDHDCFNMAVRTVACNIAWLIIEDKYHFMDLKFCAITQFGRDPRCCDKVDYKELAKLLECWPDMDYDIKDCSTVLLPYYRDRFYTLFIIDRGNKVVYIMDPHSPNLWYLWYIGNDPSMPYITTLHNIFNHFNLAMKLANPAWNDNIYVWRREFKKGVPKTLDWKLAGFLVYNFLKSWNGERLPFINTISHSLRTEFLVDILKSSGNECTDIIPGELQDLLKQFMNYL